MSKEKSYRIGDACKQLEIQPYVLRYWETEFPPLSPDKSKAGQRLYTEQDLAVIRRIKELLYGEGYTIAGAKKKLESELAAGGPAVSAAPSPQAAPRAQAAKSGSKSAAKQTKLGADVAPDATPDAERLQELEDSQRALRAGVEKVLGEARTLLDSLAS